MYFNKGVEVIQWEKTVLSQQKVLELEVKWKEMNLNR